MKLLIQILLVIIISTQISKAQTLKGKITSQSGDPVPYSTVYIQELKQGTVANTKGDYEIRLPAGKYSVIYQSLGYEPIFATISLTDKILTRDVILPIQYYSIPEVRISASGEDPAYIIMRKVIGMAPYYLNHVSHYKADVYLKGNLVINKIPRILRKSMEINVGSSSSNTIMKEGDVYLMESVNEIEFTAPDKYFQKVISINSTFPDQGNEISPMDFIQASLYQPVLVDMAISPLSPVAFSHYNFRYQGASLQGNFVINKIEVIPKRKSQQLFTGTIYIIEDLWCLHSVDLTNENLLGKIRLQQLYIPVQDDIWMPVSHKFDINIGIIGFKADVGYGSSVKYTEVQPNLALQKPETISTNYPGKPAATSDNVDLPVTKEREKIDKILEKDDLSNRDMVKLARLMEKESENSLPDSSRNNLEIKDNTTQVVEKDAGKKDSAYWAEIRPIPLSEIEMRSIKISDSTKTASSLKEQKSDTTITPGQKRKNTFFRTVREIGLGHTWSDTSGFSFTQDGLFDLNNLSFNTVDGFIYGIDFRMSKSWKNNNSLSVVPDFRWAFSRQQPMWRLNTTYRFNRMKQKQIFFRAGITSKDISNAGSINTFLNTVTSLLQKNNYLKLYESRYLNVGFRSEIVNGLTLELSTRYEERKVLQNTTDFSLIKSSKTYSDNTPVNDYLAAGTNPVNELRDQRHADFVTKVTYIPYQKYRLNNGNKIPMGSDWPTFNLSWLHGINEFPEIAGRYKHYDMLKFEAFKSKSIGAFSEFRWIVRAGGFFDNRELTFYDFFHFNSQPLSILINNYSDAFMLPAYYSLSTPEVYGEVHMKYTTPYLLLKLLPVLSNTLMRENISFAYLGSRYHKNYTEIGYSISEFLFLAEVGVYVGFEDIQYKSAGAKLVLRFN